MTKAQKATYISQTLNELYPETPIPLNHQSTFELLIAVLLSAQCTDERVNKITPVLFADGSTPEAVVHLGIEEIAGRIRSCGLYRNKSKNVYMLSETLIKDYNSRVPNTFEALEKLPGVGHKTASVVMSQGFGVPAFPVDTHIHRLARRWGLSNGKNVVQTEKDLKRLFPKEDWNRLHLQIIYYGRQYCPARGHQAQDCVICNHLGKN
jgi:endonuclease-3